MKKSFLLPLVAAIVAAGGAYATAETGMRESAFGKIGDDCQPGLLVEPENCSANETQEQCQVTINGLPAPAYSDAGCNDEIFRQSEN